MRNSKAKPTVLFEETGINFCALRPLRVYHLRAYIDHNLKCHIGKLFCKHYGFTLKIPV